MHPSDVWYGKDFRATALRIALGPASWLYSMGWRAYAATYQLGWKQATEPHVPVVCVGNLMVGGTGKTPTTMAIASVLRDLNYHVVLSLSGYGAPHAEAAALAPDGPLDAAEWGDEPAMVRWLFPELPLVVGRRRVEAARIVHEHFPDSVMLMDDGFQHLPLRKHLTILLDPAKSANTSCLPAGPYRQPRSARKSADLVLPGQFTGVYAPLVFQSPNGQSQPPAGPYSLLCALGNPAGFVSSVTEALGRPPEHSALLPDHDRLDAGSLLRDLPPELPVVVTAKDWVKLRARADLGSRQFVVAHRSVRIEPEAAFRDWLKARLDGITAKSSAR